MFKFFKKAAAVAIAAVTMMSSLAIGSVTASAAEVATNDEVGASTQKLTIKTGTCYNDYYFANNGYGTWGTCAFTFTSTNSSYSSGAAVCVEPGDSTPFTGNFTVSEITDNTSAKNTNGAKALRTMAYYNELYKNNCSSKVFTYNGTKYSWIGLLKKVLSDNNLSTKDTYLLYHYAASYAINNDCAYATSAARNAAKAIYNSAKSVSNPSWFKIYLAKPSNSSYQTLMLVPTYKVNLSIQKKSSNTSITNGNDCYSLKGAEFTIYHSDGTVAKKIYTDKNGYCEANGLVLDTYSYKETNAPAGYEAASGQVEFTDGELSGNTITYSANVSETPVMDPVPITIATVKIGLKSYFSRFSFCRVGFLVTAFCCAVSFI